MVMPEDFAELAKRVNNWGRWGPADERGTLNLITEEAITRAAATVRRGRRFPLALPLHAGGPQTGTMPGRINPLRTMVLVNEQMFGPDHPFRTSDDVVTMGLQAATHWDSLAHVSYDGRLYNGFPPATITAHGAAHCGIDKAGAIVGRGVLLDVARARGVERITSSLALTPDDLEAAEELGRVRVGSGDIVLVRTGQMKVLQGGDKRGYTFPSPGPSMQTVPWLHERGVAAIATDNMTFEVFPGEVEGCLLPVHLLHLVEMGLLQGQNWDLEALADDCADDGVYEFFLSATPEPFRHAVGAPVAPVAVK